AGYMHTYEGPAELARQGARVLLGTAHGVILTNPRQSRYAWIYVAYRPHGDVKLRHPSIAGARLQGDTAIITLERSWVGEDNPTGGARSNPPQVRVNLNTGAVSQSWR
ncbi:MAG: hypothetical protein ACRD1P_13330, partial [Thermoanaerobaculia bacterium]